jgi:hypothetical protein
MTDTPDAPSDSPNLPDQPMALEEPTAEFDPQIDQRPRMPEPLPVRIVAIGDVRLPAPPGVEPELDAFYIGLFGFERIAPLELPIYRADNFTLRFSVREPPVVHDSLRALIIEVPSLGDAVHKLNQTKLEYTRQRGIAPGTESLILLDPAGNWIELVETRLIA